ncbi:MAG: hypothetical protein MJY41_00060 [Bacteroidales bacterium]|nr:hypothetical protein [Bacteroidales bacterium]
MNQKMSKTIPELNYLLSEVEKHYGRRISTSTDFEALSVVIEHDINEIVSASTLKRLWGYVTSNPIPRVSTLDVLSRYIGYKDFLDFCDTIKNTPAFESGFFSSKCINTTELSADCIVRIGWHPNRLVSLQYLGNYRFKVKDSINSQLKEGDEFEATSFVLGYPLYIPRIFRDGEYTQSYIAGSNDGLSVLDTE